SGPDTITVSTAADTTGKTQNVTFAADAATNHVADFTVDKNAAIANGTDTVTGTIVIQDKQGNVVPDVQVTAKDVTGATLSTLPKTDAQGKTTFTFTNVKSGPDTITVSTAADTTGKTQNVTFAADAATNHVADFTVDRTTAIANGTDTVTGTIVIQDKQGNVVPDVQVIAKDVTGASISTPAKTDAQGKTTFRFTNMKSGPDTITVSTAADTTGKSQNITFTAIVPLIEYIVGNHDAIFPTESLKLTAHVVDQSGNKVKNCKVYFSSTGSTLSQKEKVTDNNGNAVIEAYPIKNEEKIKVSATLGDSSSKETIAKVITHFTLILNKSSNYWGGFWSTVAGSPEEHELMVFHDVIAHSKTVQLPIETDMIISYKVNPTMYYPAGKFQVTEQMRRNGGFCNQEGDFYFPSLKCTAW
ncbi:hypothetical protein C9J21_14635, partial [Photobacterium phosphoreum]|uniref:Ig-like domain-containing protein n=1 Tax=Photobacterium phosphoreum TaxID=659 RepID=UPI000D4FDA27